jgi:hypothetical protein
MTEQVITAQKQKAIANIFNGLCLSSAIGLICAVGVKVNDANITKEATNKANIEQANAHYQRTDKVPPGYELKTLDKREQYKQDLLIVRGSAAAAIELGLDPVDSLRAIKDSAAYQRLHPDN